MAEQGRAITRRNMLRWSALMAAMGGPISRRMLCAQSVRGPGGMVVPLRDGWNVTRDDGTAVLGGPVTLPNTPVQLSWQNWKAADWQTLWLYRCSFASPLAANDVRRVLLHFDGVLSGATVSLNGQRVGEHLGGFLPFEFEITNLLRSHNELAVTVDGRWLNVPPSGSAQGAEQLDYLLPAGIHRGVSLRVVPEVFIESLFAKPMDVLTYNRRLDVRCTLNGNVSAEDRTQLQAELLDGSRVIATGMTAGAVSQAARSETALTLSGLSSVELWSPEIPKLYTLRTTLMKGTEAAHTYTTRVGFREAKFTVDGFFLNGKKTRIFGLNRHELFPYAGFAMPDRVMRHDAAILKNEMHVNTVRCSHYPQTEAFLDACDELGLMVWEEVPGWQYIGDDRWKDLLLRDVRDMIVRDRNHPSIIIWGVRANESANDVPLYAKTTALGKSLDDLRPMSGSMDRYSTQNWAEDVFAYDDYHARPDGSVAMHSAIPGVPFFFSEAVGQFAYEHGGGFKQFYRRTASRSVLEGQAKYHAQGHDRAADDPRVGGVIAWCAFDYASYRNGYNAVKCPGVIDTFRIPKLGAAFYQAQVSPKVKPVIAPSFYWEASDGGPGKQGLVFSNCDRLDVTIGAHPAVTLTPLKAEYPNVLYPPFAIDLSHATENGGDLVIEGFVADTSVLIRRFSLDRSKDRLVLQCDDTAIANDGSDATRVWFSVCDRYGALVPHREGAVKIALTGAGELVGDTTFNMAETGGVGAVWVRAIRGAQGVITIAAEHPRFPAQRVTVQAVALGERKGAL